MPPTSTEFFSIIFFCKARKLPADSRKRDAEVGVRLYALYFFFFGDGQVRECLFLPLNAHVFHVALNAHWCASITLPLSAHVLDMALNTH